MRDRVVVLARAHVGSRERTERRAAPLVREVSSVCGVERLVSYLACRAVRLRDELAAMQRHVIETSG